MKRMILLTGVVLALSACSEVKETVGLGRNAPDEYAVIERAPLTLPPNYELRVPDPGAPRPQDSNLRERAEQALTKSGSSAQGNAPTTTGTAALLQKAGAGSADPDIRRTVEKESGGVMRREPGFVDRMMFWDGKKPPEPEVDPTKEKKRLKSNQDEGRPANEGAVPVIDRKKKAPLEGIF